MVDPDLELSGGGGLDLLALLAFFPSVISSFLIQNKGGGRGPVLINCYYESLCENLDVTFINNKRVTSDIYGNINEQVFYDDVHLNNRIGTRKLVTNIKHHLGLRGRNVESLPRTSNTIVNCRNARLEGPTRTQALNLQHQARNQISQPLQALNLLAEYITAREMFLR